MVNAWLKHAPSAEKDPKAPVHIHLLIASSMVGATEKG
jgi:hypothetical protein